MITRWTIRYESNDQLSHFEHPHLEIIWSWTRIINPLYSGNLNQICRKISILLLEKQDYPLLFCVSFWQFHGTFINAKELTPWNRTGLEKPVVRLASQIPRLLWNQKFQCSVTRARHRSLLWDRQMQRTISYTVSLRSVLLLLSHPHLGFCMITSTHIFQTKFFVHISSPHARYNTAHLTFLVFIILIA